MPRARCRPRPTPADRIFRLDRPTDHQRDEIVFRELLVDLVGALAVAVAKDRDAVGKRQNLRQPVAHIDDRQRPPATMRRMIPLSFSTPEMSRLEVGSSSSRTFGFAANALTISRNCRCEAFNCPTSASGEMPRS